jgi:hypothetical protein
MFEAKGGASKRKEAPPFVEAVPPLMVPPPHPPPADVSAMPKKERFAEATGTGTMVEDPDPFEYFVWVVRHEEAISHGSGPMPVPQKNFLLERFLKGFSVFVAEAHKLRVSDLEIVRPILGGLMLPREGSFLLVACLL